jgi:hypothetical protein
MRKVILCAALSVASLPGMHSPLLGAEPAAPLRASGRNEHQAANTAKHRDYGPYTRELADHKAAIWKNLGFRAVVYSRPNGWYVRVYFLN